MAAAASAEIEREIQQLTTRLQRLRNLLADVLACIAEARRTRRKAANREDPSAVVRSNQHISLLERQYVTLFSRRDRVSEQLAVLKRQARQ